MVRSPDVHVEHVCKVSRPISRNGVDIWTFMRKNEYDTLFASYDSVLV